MGTVVADRVDRPLSLFDEIEAPAPAQVPDVAPEPKRLADGGGDAAVAPGSDATSSGVARVRDGVGGEPTLDDLVVRAWEGLTAQAAATCPLCAGTLRPFYADAASGSPPVGGRCETCGTTLE